MDEYNEFASCPSHCCIFHGCKYGLEGCPVVSGVVRQQYLCERCQDDEITSIGQAEARSKGAASVEFLRELQERVGDSGGIDLLAREFFDKLCKEAKVTPKNLLPRNERY